MKIKVDDIVKLEVLKSTKSRIRIAADIGISTVQLRKILDRQEMELKYVVAIGKSIGYDFSRHFPELDTERLGSILGKDVAFAKMGNPELRDSLIELQEKYINLLEQHISLLNKSKD